MSTGTSRRSSRGPSPSTESQRKYVVDELLRQLKTLRGTRICILGLAFKPDTDDLRDSPALDVACRLIDKGAFVSAYDPMVTEVPVEGIRLMPDAIQAAADADAVVLATEWPQFLSVDLTELRGAMRGDIFFDGRNNFDPELVAAGGLPVPRDRAGLHCGGVTVRRPNPGRTGPGRGCDGSVTIFPLPVARFLRHPSAHRSAPGRVESRPTWH